MENTSSPNKKDNKPKFKQKDDKGGMA